MAANRLTDKQLGEALRAARKASGLTLEGLADELGFRTQTLSRWETLENEGRPDKGTKMLHYFVALLRLRADVRDRLLREIGALDGGLRDNDPEVERRADLVRRAYQSDSGTIRQILGLLEYALREAADNESGRATG